MKEVRKQALALRLKGASYNEIRAVLGVPKSTQSGWFRDLVLSDRAVARLKARTLQGTINAFVKRNKLQTHYARIRARTAHTMGMKEVSALSSHELRIVGIAIYWAEGYKRLRVRDGKQRTNHPIALVNADGDMVRIFIRFLKEVMDVDEKRIVLSMRLYAHINEIEARNYWMKVTGLPLEQFKRTTYLVSGASKGTRPFNRLPWGTLNVQVFSTYEFHRLMGMIEGMKSKL